MYWEVHIGLNEHLKCKFSVIWSYRLWQTEDFWDINKWSFPSQCSVKGMTVAGAGRLHVQS